MKLREALDADVWYWVAAALVLAGVGGAILWVDRVMTPVAESCACAMAPSAQAVPAVGAARGRQMVLHRSADGRLWEVPG